MTHYTLISTPIVLKSEKPEEVFEQYPMALTVSAVNTVPSQNQTNNHKLTKSSTVSSIVDYRRRMNVNLYTMNNNLSEMLQEGLAGIDDICNKVRNCYMGLDLVPKSTPTPPPQETPSENKTVKDIPSDVSVIEETEVDDSTDQQQLTELITPFITILHPRTEDNESVLNVKASRQNNIYQSINEISEVLNLDKVLENMVDDISRQIEKSYSGVSNSKMQNQENTFGKEDTKKIQFAIKRRQQAPKLKQIPYYSKLKYTMTNPRRTSTTRLRDIGRNFCTENNFEYTQNMRSKNTPSSVISRLNCAEADVYRKKAHTDINKKLNAQIEANDSLLFFEKLMQKVKDNMGNNRISKKEKNRNIAVFEAKGFKYCSNSSFRQIHSTKELSEKYQNSLWFRNSKKSKSHTTNKNQRGKKTIENKTLNAKNNFRKFERDNAAFTVAKTLSRSNKPTIIKSSHNIVQEVDSEKKQVPCCPIGNSCKMTITNDLPLSDSDKCKLQWMRTKCSQRTRKNIEYLDILDDITQKDILPLQSEYPRKDHLNQNKCIKNTYLYKLMYGNNSKIQDAWSHLFEPKVTCSKKDCAECRTDCMKKSTSQLQVISHPKSPRERYRSEVVKKLSKYIFPEDHTPKYVYTVMPVIVSYDNYPPLSPERNRDISIKLPLAPIRDTKHVIKKTECTIPVKKPLKIIYDALPKKEEKDETKKRIRNNNKTVEEIGQGRSLPPYQFSNQYCSSPRLESIKVDFIPKSKNISKSPQKVLQKKSNFNERIIISPTSKESSSNENSARLKLQSQNQSQVFSRRETPKGVTEKLSHSARSKPLKVPVGFSSSCDYLNLDITGKQKSPDERRLWSNKYGKTVSQKLIHYIESQGSNYQIPVPKYALPLKREPKTKQSVSFRLQSLKEKSNTIQNNIEKAISVIENKMMDMLSQPSSTTNAKAFGEMEKEITNVLNAMKTTNDDTHAVAEKKIEEELDEEGINALSDELFQRLDKLLANSSDSKTNIKTEDTPKDKTTSPVFENGDKNRKTDKKPIRSPKTKPFPITTGYDQKRSSNSPSGDLAGTFTVTAVHSPKRKSKNEQAKTVKPKNETDYPIHHLQGADGDQNLFTSKSKETQMVDKPTDDLPQDSNEELLKEIQDLLIKYEMIDAEPDVPGGDMNKHFEVKTNKNKDTVDLEMKQAAVVENNIVLQEKEIDSNCPVNISETSDNISPHSIQGKGDTKDNDKQQFCEEVHKIISRMETIYTKLDEFDEEPTTSEHLLNADIPPKVSIFREKPVEKVESESFLTPFMNAVKVIRTNQEEIDNHFSESTKKSPSYYNVITFLENLAQLEEKPLEVYTTRANQQRHTSQQIIQQKQTMDVKSIGTGDDSNCVQDKNETNHNTYDKTNAEGLLSPQNSMKVFCQMTDKTEVIVEDIKQDSDTDGENFEAQECILKNNGNKIYDTKEFIENQTDFVHDENSRPTNKNSENKTNDCNWNKIDTATLIENKLNKVFDGFYGKDSLLKVKELKRDNLELRKQNSLEKLLSDSEVLKHFIQEKQLLLPLEHLDKFIDVETLKEDIKKRQKMRLLRRKSSTSVMSKRNSKVQNSRWQKSNGGLLKGFYAFMYILVFTALNMEYKCM